LTCLLSPAPARQSGSPGKPSLVIAEMPANGGLLRIGRRSPRSGISHFWPGTADSLRPIFEIFPFLGDRDRRPGSICTAWSLWQSSSGTSQLISHKIGVTQNIRESYSQVLKVFIYAEAVRQNYSHGAESFTSSWPVTAT
jgi:hypothetical protein